MKVRIKFRKFGAMIFIGHLDIMRYFQKAIRRADLDIAYSQGYNPHQIMSFAAPLGVGLTSNGEYFDIECNFVTSSEDMKNKLQAVMVEGIEIVNVKSLPETVGNAMASVAAAEYTVRLRYESLSDVDYISRLDSFYHQKQILVTKQTKKSEKELDIKPLIYALSVKMEDGKPVFSMLVDASSSGNIKPGLVLNAFYLYMGYTAGEMDFVVTREDTFTNLGDLEHPDFAPLDAVGEVIA